MFVNQIIMPSLKRLFSFLENNGMGKADDISDACTKVEELFTK